MQRPFSRKPVFGRPRRRSPKRSADDIASDILSPVPPTLKSALSAPGTDPIDPQPFQIDDVGLAGESDRLNAFPGGRQSRGQLSQQAQGPDNLLISPQADSLTQPLGGRPNRNNANLDSFALGQAGVSPGSPADSSAVLPPEVETIEDYRRLMETGSVSGDMPPALAFELANRAGSSLPAGILAQVGPGDVGPGEGPGEIGPGEIDPGQPGEGDGPPPGEEPEEPADEPEEPEQPTQQPPQDAEEAPATDFGLDASSGRIEKVRDVKLTEMVPDEKKNTVQPHQDARDAGLDLIESITELASERRTHGEAAKTTADNLDQARMAAAAYVRDRHIDGLAAVIADDEATKAELREAFIAAASQNPRGARAGRLLAAMDKLFPASEYGDDGSLAAARAALQKQVAIAGGPASIDTDAALEGLETQRSLLQGRIERSQEKVDRIQGKIADIQEKVNEVQAEIDARQTRLDEYRAGMGDRDPTPKEEAAFKAEEAKIASLGARRDRHGAKITRFNQTLVGTDDNPGPATVLAQQQKLLTTVNTVIDYYDDESED
jgi:hypothetical protein